MAKEIKPSDPEQINIHHQSKKMNTAAFDLQPSIESETIKIRPLKSADFEQLYTVASDPLLWEQHPNKDRYKREVFETFFKGAIESKGAFLVLDAKTNSVIGSSRYYELNEKENSVCIGYTFLARDHWGSTYNQELKKIMIAHAFNFVNKVHFHIGATNTRSQKAIERTGAKKIGEIEMEYYGEPSRLNFIYEIEKQN